MMPKPSAGVALAGEDAEAMEAFLAWATGVLGVMMETGALGMMWCGVRVDTVGRVGAGFAAVAVEAGDAREVRGVVPVPVRVREGTFSVLGRDVVEGRFAAAAAAAAADEAPAPPPAQEPAAVCGTLARQRRRRRRRRPGRPAPRQHRQPQQLAKRKRYGRQQQRDCRLAQDAVEREARVDGAGRAGAGASINVGVGVGVGVGFGAYGRWRLVEHVAQINVDLKAHAVVVDDDNVVVFVVAVVAVVASTG